MKLNEIQRVDTDEDGFDSIAPITQHVKMKVAKIYIQILVKDTIYQMTLVYRHDNQMVSH